MLENTTNFNLNDLNKLTSDEFINKYKLNRDFDFFKTLMVNLNETIETMNDTNEQVTELKQNMTSLMNWVNNYSPALENRHVVNNLKKVTQILNEMNNQAIISPTVTETNTIPDITETNTPVITVPNTTPVDTETNTSVNIETNTSDNTETNTFTETNTSTKINTSVVTDSGNNKKKKKVIKVTPRNINK